jgi:hypothetical protein
VSIRACAVCGPWPLCSAALWADLRRQLRAGTAGVAARLAAKTTLHYEETRARRHAVRPAAGRFYGLVRDEGWPVEALPGWLANLLQLTSLP